MKISHLQPHDNFKGNGADSFWFQFCCDKPISREKQLDVSYVIENYLNNQAISGHEISEKPTPEVKEVTEEIIISVLEKEIYWNDYTGVIIKLILKRFITPLQDELKELRENKEFCEKFRVWYEADQEIKKSYLAELTTLKEENERLKNYLKKIGHLDSEWTW